MAFYKNTLRQIINNAKKQAKSEGYSQVVYLDKNGEYCFTRWYTALNISFWCARLCGFVSFDYNEHGCPIQIWYSTENHNKKVIAKCKTMAKEIIYFTNEETEQYK